MDWRIKTEWDRHEKQFRAVLRVDGVTLTFWGETREEAWVLALKQLVELWSEARRADMTIELREGNTWIN